MLQKSLFSFITEKAHKIYYGAKRLDHTNLPFRDVHIIKLPDFVKLKTGIIMFKAYHYMLPMNVQPLFRIYESLYSSRHKYKFIQIYACTNLKSMCISVTGVKLWNYLDIVLITCKKNIISESVIQINCCFIILIYLFILL